MAVTYSNIIQSHRGVYFEATGDGATTALTVSHGRSIFNGTTAVATVTTAPTTSITERKSGCGGFIYPHNGTTATVSSVSVSATSVTVNTQAAVSNGVKAYVAVVFNQSSPVT